MSKDTRRIETTITLTPDGSEIRTRTRGHAAEDNHKCEAAAVAHAMANVARNSPLGFEACLDALAASSIEVARRTRRAK